MAAATLRTSDEITDARAELHRRRLSCLSRFIPTLYWLRRIGIRGPIPVGYHIKSWDVLKTVQFIEERLPHTAAILDFGAFTSEIPCILHRLRYVNVHGIDLNPEVTRMPYRKAVHYVEGDFLSTPFADASFDALTAISAIEHGYQEDRLLAECSRLLRPGGYFIASLDYWPEKLDTTGVTMYDLDWRIFSRDEVLQLIERSRAYGFEPVGPLDLDAGVPVMEARFSKNYAYTFAWIALRKRQA